MSDKPKWPECSICPGKKAVNESRFNPGTYYCASCANYIAMEYGMTHLLPIHNDKEKKK